MNKIRFLSIGMIMFNMVILFNARAQPAVNEKESARVFVQKFYDWYKVLYATPPGKKQAERSSIIAIKKHPEYFDAALSKAIINDAAAQSKIKGDMVGLDFDPYLAAQDDGFSYQAGNVKPAGNKFLIEMHCGSNTQSKKEILAAEVTVIAEVANVNNHWIFTNFIYPTEGRQQQTNLLQILASLRKDRGETKK